MFELAHRDFQIGTESLFHKLLDIGIGNLTGIFRSNHINYHLLQSSLPEMVSSLRDTLSSPTKKRSPAFSLNPALLTSQLAPLDYTSLLSGV